MNLGNVVQVVGGQGRCLAAAARYGCHHRWTHLACRRRSSCKAHATVTFANLQHLYTLYESARHGAIMAHILLPASVTCMHHLVQRRLHVISEYLTASAQCSNKRHAISAHDLDYLLDMFKTRCIMCLTEVCNLNHVTQTTSWRMGAVLQGRFTPGLSMCSA